MKHSKALIALCLCLAIIAASGMYAAPVYAKTAATNLVAEVEAININTSSVEELQKISGIGPKLAARIIEYRDQNGVFSAPEDIMNVRGVGEAKYAKIKDILTV
jgi:competence protein ComEA